MNQEKQHITEYKVYGIVLVVLLLLTALSILVTHIDLKAWTVGIALLVTCSMAFIILTYFMHLKFDNLLIKILVGLVFVLFAIFVGITLIEYMTR
jgi:cytochrome c oxidase subunit IV